MTSPIFARVHTLVKSIPKGRVATYGQLSALIDGRLTPVGIGWAMHAAGAEEIPWHRVINSKGGISTGGESLQRPRLEAEGVEFRRDGTIDLTIYQWKRQWKRQWKPRRKKQREHKGL